MVQFITCLFSTQGCMEYYHKHIFIKELFTDASIRAPFQCLLFYIGVVLSWL